MESSIILPITFWNNPQPTFRISSIRITPNGRKLVTSCYDGELFTWDFNINTFKITPRNVLIGHSDPVTCLECMNDYAISTSEGGEICRWNLEDGYCSKSIKSVFVHRSIQLFKCSLVEDDLLFTCGDYHEIFIINSVILHTILVLHSKTESDWISCFQVIPSIEIGNDVVSGVTRSGYIKLWIIQELSDNISYEVQSSLLPMKDVSHIKCSQNQTQILVISDRCWTIFDARFLKTIYSGNRICNERFIGGDFLDGEILIWTNESRFYIFKLSIEGANLKTVFSNTSDLPQLFEPAMCYFRASNELYLIQCNISGQIVFWDVNKGNKMPVSQCELVNKFSDFQCGIFKKCTREVTCCIVVSELDLFVAGCSDGTIVVVSTVQTLMAHYFNSKSENPSLKNLFAHKGRINCFLYPHEKYSYHNKSHLLSGGSDFSICLWDILTFKLIHRFCVQSGEIIKLLVPPEECNTRVKYSICSVANDHSVAILNLKELKCIVLASRQLFPVVTINWRPLDDFIILECFDGTVYIWEMETGHLDRVLHGVTAQEVIYACRESNHEDVSNFYLREDCLVGKDNFRRGLYQIEKDFQTKPCSVTVRGFLDSFHSENQIVLFNVDRILERSRSRITSEKTDLDVYHNVRMLTHATQSTSAKKSSMKHHPESMTCKKEIEKSSEANIEKNLIQFLLLILQNKIGEDEIQFGLVSQSLNFSIFMSKSKKEENNILDTYKAIAMVALNSEEPSDQRLKLLNHDFHLETVAKLWQSRCVPVRNIARKMLLIKLASLSHQQKSLLLQKWFKYLPHFGTVDGTRINKFDHELTEMRAIALVLFGVIGSEFKFKLGDVEFEELYLEETCSAILHLLRYDSDLQAIAVNLLGRGYAVWEQKLKFEMIFHFLFDMTYDHDVLTQTDFLTPELDKCLNAHEALKAIAVARTDAFLSCFTREITQIRNSQSPKAESAFMEKSKTEVVLILMDLLVRTPYIMLQHLNDILIILIYCINFGHFKQERIDTMIPVLSKFKQVHHCVATQRIAVGLHDGSVVIHELKTYKTHRINAHTEMVNAVMFSPDGKVLATYSRYENRLCFWHVFTGIFGLGQVHIKCMKTFETNQLLDEDIRNHLEIAELQWLDNKSVLLRLCDGSTANFHM